MTHQRVGTVCLIILGMLIALAYIVPFALLRDVQAWHGAFLFWTVFGLLVLGVIARLVAEWRP